ncbi:MAG: Activator of Hsp90 ATPase 1 family protein [Marmoricola sp.]|nr:Activator of Hsp90 ATPase 1 family protein [Marmoricola sp.]
MTGWPAEGAPPLCLDGDAAPVLDRTRRHRSTGSVSHTDVGRLLVPATCEVVFAALVDADAREHWLPPTGMTGRFDRFDARTGGGYRLVLTYDDPATPGKSGAATDVVDVRFTAVERPGLVVEEADFVSDDPALTGTMTMTWTLEPTTGGTLVTITATDVPDGIDSADHAVAFEATLRQLAAHVADQHAT